jgi:hypothetical protein|tara:strand:- start:94 stop:357 length:264 start_codon:yes stop_codon:yes gene_type:complete
MLERFLIEFAVIVIAFLILRKYWNIKKVRYYFGASVIGLNVFACWLYIYLVMTGVMILSMAMGKIMLHGIVAIIIWTFREVIKEKDE